MRVKLTDRTPDGVLIDLEGTEVRTGGRAVLSLSEAQLASLTTMLGGKLADLRRARDQE